MTTSTTETSAAPKKKAAKKAPKKAAKAPKKGKAAKAPRAKKEGLRKPQVRVLEALAKSKKSLSRTEISEKGGVDLAMLNSYIGSQDDSIRKKNDELVCKSLLTLGFVKYGTQQEEGRGMYYDITPAGRKALDSAKAAK
jgi:DNA-binding MarR family transcriptional regulator